MRGSCDISVSKMLCLHIPSLIPQHFSAIDVASPVQSAAVAGAGLLYQGSSHRMMTEFLLNEIGKRPSSDVNVLDREAYTLSCGIALGMVNLCQGEGPKSEGEGTGNAGLADLRIEERLYRYIVGGQDDVEMRRRRDETDRLSLPSMSGANGNDKCSCIYEGELINTDVTAPGATLALGLIYMKSGNKTIASAISLPDTHFLLEYVRPDFLMLRVIARALILWDEVEPSNAWIESQLPVAVHSAYAQMRDLAKNLAHQTTGSSPATQDKEFDRQAVRLIYTHIIAGACFAIGLRFAGTGNRDAAAAIFERVLELRDLRDGSDPVSCALRPAAPVLEMCLGSAATSLAMVLAGTGDLETLRLLKLLRWRCDEDVNYGSHMAYGAAIGLLFLGGATCTLGREPEDIAALIMSFYPRYPSTTSDNQYHLQALRNLYAIAVKHRELRAVDVDTGESVFVPIEVSIFFNWESNIDILSHFRFLRSISRTSLPIPCR
jgi:anaphase-promoting complex subunit 1